MIELHQRLMLAAKIILDFYSFFSFLLKYSLFTMLLPISAVQQSDPFIHICTFPFLCKFPSWSIPRDWILFPVLYSRTSLLIHSKCQCASTNPELPIPHLAFLNAYILKYRFLPSGVVTQEVCTWFFSVSNVFGAARTMSWICQSTSPHLDLSPLKHNTF